MAKGRKAAGVRRAEQDLKDRWDFPDPLRVLGISGIILLVSVFLLAPLVLVSLMDGFVELWKITERGFKMTINQHGFAVAFGLSFYFVIAHYLGLQFNAPTAVLGVAAGVAINVALHGVKK